MTPMLDHLVTGHRRRRRDDASRAASEHVRVGDGHLGRGRARRERVRRCWPRPRAPRPTRSGGCSSSPTSRCPGTPRCSRSATWCRSAAATRCPASRRWRCRWGATRPSSSSGAAARRRTSGRSSTRTRATWRRSGAARAVAELPPRHPRLRASPPGRCGSAIHLWYLVGFQNRLLVFIRWGFSFLTHGRGTRLITGEQNMP